MTRHIRQYGSAALVAILLGALTVLPTRIPYAPPHADRSELTVSFKIAGRVISKARPADDDELLSHMRRAEVVERERLPVHMRVDVDGRTVVDRAYVPGGLFEDGASLAMERIEVESGPHTISIEIDDGGTQPFVLEKHIEFASGRKRVVLFDREAGFRLY